MSEATIQAALREALAPLVAEGSVTVNDHETPQKASRARSPWLVIETADVVRADTGPGYTTPSATYEPLVSIVVYYPQGQMTEAAHVTAFQELRQAVIAALLQVDNVEAVETVGALAEYFGADDSLFQRLKVRVTEYEV